MTNTVPPGLIDKRNAGERIKVRVMDLDGHFVEPEALWREYLPARLHEIAPKNALDSAGRRRLIIGNETLPFVNFAVRRPKVSEDDPPEGSGFDPTVRLAVMDAEGVDVHVMYPTTGLQFGAISDLSACVELCRAYNNWAHDFCSVAPNRLIAHAAVPQQSVSETRREIDRAVGELGLGGIFLRPNPVGPSLEDPIWEPVWSQIEDYDVPLGIHEGTGYVMPRFGSDRTDNYIFQHAMSHPFEHMAALLSLIGTGVLERHPNLRVVFAEAGCGWVPYWLERLDHHFGEFQCLGVDLHLKPSEYFLRQCMVTMDSDEGAVVPAFVACLGSETLGWSTDFPHADHVWRGMVGQLLERPDLAEGDKKKIIGENAARFYRLTP